MLTHWKWVKADGTKSYAFIEVDDEYDGDTIIQEAHRIVLDGAPLRAARCSNSRPVLLQNATCLTIDEHPNHSFYYHYIHGLG